MRLKKDALTKANRDTMLKGHVDAMLKPLTKVKRVPIDLTHWFLIVNGLTHWFVIIIGEEECGNNFEEYEAFPPSVMRPEDMTDQEVTGFNDDDSLPRVDNVDQMLRDVEFQGVYTSSELSRLK